MRKTLSIVTAVALIVASAIFLHNRLEEEPNPRAIKLSLSLGTEDDPHAQAEMEFLITRDPRTNTIPRDIRRREFEFARTIPVQRDVRFAKGKTRSSTAMWMERGPNNIGGRTRVFAADVVNPDVLIAGAVAGGIWKSTNDGTSWRLTTQPWQIHTTTCIAQDIRAGKTATWYVGTGEFRGSTTNNTRWGSFYRGDGIYKSTDNGESWVLLPSTVSGTPHQTESFDYIWNIAVNAIDSTNDEIYAATWDGIYRSTNGGDSWTLVQAADSGLVNTGGFTTDVAITSTGVVYAHTKQSGSPRIWRSADGVTWTDIKPPTFPTVTGRIVFGLAQSNPNVVYVFIESANNTPATSGHQLWKYTHADTGGTWVNRGGNLPSGLSTQTGYDMTVHVKPDNENFVLIGGTNLYRSTDGFATSTATTTIGGYPYWPGLNHHPDLHSGFFRGGNPGVYYSGHDGGLSKTDDVAATSVEWINLNNGYNVTQFYSVSISPESSNTMIMAGAQDNGTLLGDAPGLSDWIMVYGGDGTVAKIPPASDDRLYTQYQNGQMQRHTLDITNTTNITPSGSNNQLFVNPIALDPNNSAILYYAAGRTSPSLTSAIWRNDNAPSATTTVGWTALVNTNVGAATGYTRRISALGVSKANSANVLYYGTVDGIVKRVDEAHSSAYVVTDITPPGLGGGTSQGGFVRCVAVDPNNSDIALVAFGNYNFQNLWYTTDGGASWTDVEGNLSGPDGPSVRWATIFYLDTTMHAFIGTSIGLQSTTALDGSQTVWAQEANTAIGNILIAMMDYREADRTLAVGTHARGVFTATFDSPVGVPPPEGIPSAFGLEQNYPNPFNPSTVIPYSLPHAARVMLKVFDANGREVATLVNGVQEAGTHDIRFTVSNLASGVYFYRLETPEFTATRKLLLLR
jgi:hypothetical protein